MSQYSRSNRSSRTVRPDNSRPSSVSSRCHTITSDDAADYPSAGEGIQVSYPRSNYSESPPRPRPQQRSSETSFSLNPPVRIHSPSPSRGNVSAGAPHFFDWLQSPSGPNLSREEAQRSILAMSRAEQEEAERKARLERSVSQMNRSAYSESVFEDQASNKAKSLRSVAATSARSYREPAPPSTAPPSQHSSRAQSTPKPERRHVESSRENSIYTKSAHPSEAPSSLYGAQRQQRGRPMDQNSYLESVYSEDAPSSLHGAQRQQHEEPKDRVKEWVEDQTYSTSSRSSG